MIVSHVTRVRGGHGVTIVSRAVAGAAPEGAERGKGAGGGGGAGAGGDISAVRGGFGGGGGAAEAMPGGPRPPAPQGRLQARRMKC
eukprot:5422030-Pyramimonas_sp.AAC.1